MCFHPEIGHASEACNGLRFVIVATGRKMGFVRTGTLKLCSRYLSLMFGTHWGDSREQLKLAK